MAWDRIKRWLPGDDSDKGPGDANVPEIGWIDPAETPWGVPVLDVRPVTLAMLSASRDLRCAENATSFGQDDGTGFLGVEPPVARRVAARLRYRIDRLLADGALFLPGTMEEKWAIFYHRGQILCVRSWLRQVQAMAEVVVGDGHVEVTAIRGTFTAEDEEPAFTVRVLDYLLRSHALDDMHPAPLPAGMEEAPPAAALWCMAHFGNHAHFATPHPVASPTPERPLRTYSTLHLAVARGDANAARSLLDAGVPVDLLDRDGHAPLHWAAAREDLSMIDFLLASGSPVDVRSDEGATALMNAVQARRVENAAFLLDRGADPAAADRRGFTALHRAAEMGQPEIVELLLDRGAAAHAEAQGHTPRSLAATRGERGIVALLDRRQSP